MGVRSTNPLQSFIDDFYRSGTDASGSAPGGGITASGGTTFTANGFKYHAFTHPNSDNFVVSSGSDSIEFIVIGGGGAGGSYRGAGGGAGGVNSNWPGFPGSYGGTSYPVTPGTYPISVGNGGTDPGGEIAANPGANSVFNGPGVNSGNPITGSGGGGGAGWPDNGGSHENGRPGGSGGGGRDNTSSAGTGSGGPSSKTTGEIGNAGGTADQAYGGAGGGGAGGAGGDKDQPDAGGPSVGGIGYGFAQIPPSYGTPGPSGPLRYFGGGGAGHIYSNTSANGGYGGGGNSSDGSPTTGDAGTAGTGGGGGGGGQASPSGGAGGSGIIIIRYST